MSDNIRFRRRSRVLCWRTRRVRSIVHPVRFAIKFAIMRGVTYPVITPYSWVPADLFRHVKIRLNQNRMYSICDAYTHWVIRVRCHGPRIYKEGHGHCLELAYKQVDDKLWTGCSLNSISLTQIVDRSIVCVYFTKASLIKTNSGN